MTTRMTKAENDRASTVRYRSAYSWFTLDEVRVLQHALETYIALGPDNSFPIKLARELLKASKR